MTEYQPVNATDLCSQAVFDLWPDTVPVHGITIIDAIRPDGHHGLHVVHDNAVPIWVLIGMLKCVTADLEARWVGEDYIGFLEDDDEEI